MQLAIYKLRDDSNPLCILSEGQHLLGRGALFDCTDKRVSRKHVSISIEASRATFSLVHPTNPCYWKCTSCEVIVLMKPNMRMNIHDGDLFGFLPNAHWFKIKVCEPEAVTTVVLEENEISIHEKFIPIAEAATHTNTENDQHNAENPQTKEETAVKSACDITTNNLDTLSDEPSCSNTANATTSDKNTPKRVFRDHCWYGSDCYRTNLEHQTLFIHPGDADYEIVDSEDNRPPCPYGRNCYRRNTDHRLEFMHSQEAKVPPKTTNKRPISDEDSNEEVDDTEDTGANKRKCQAKKRKVSSLDDEDEGDEDTFATDEDDDYEIGPISDEDSNEEVDDTEDTGANKRKCQAKKQKDSSSDDEDEDVEDPFATDEDDDYEIVFPERTINEEE